MAAEIEAIGRVAASEPGHGATFHAPGPGAGTTAPTPRPKSSEPAAGAPSSDVGLVFEVDRKSQDLVIKIVDRETHKVIRQIPPAEVQRLREAMQSILGTVLDQTG